MAKPGPWQRKPDLFTLIALELITLFVVSYQIQVEPHLNLLEKTALTFFGPFQSLTHSAFNSIEKRIRHTRSLQTLQDENRLLRQQTRAIKQLRLDLKETRDENRRLRSLVDLEPPPHWQHVVAEVIAQAELQGDHMFTINKGSRHGIVADQGVITPEGVVGIVWEVSHFYAKVLAINNMGSAIAAMVQDSRYQDAYITGRGSGGRLENVPNFSPVNVGNRVLTSGYDHIFPAGLSIGTVTSQRAASDMFQEISVRFDVRYQNIDEVMVLIPPTQGP